MTPARRVRITTAIAVAVTALLPLLWLATTGALVGSEMDAAERSAVWSALKPHASLLAVTTLLLAGAIGFAVQPLVRRYAIEPARLLEQVRVLLGTDAERSVSCEGSADLRALARAINELAAERQRLRGDIRRHVAEASRNLEQERNRLAALMSELTQAVVVCNLDGRVLLYNARAREQFRSLSDAPGVSGGAELIGLGRSIYAVFDRRLVAHALETLQQRVHRGDSAASTQFVTTTRSGQLLRAQMAPVLAAPGGDADAPAGSAPSLSGFVLMLDNITREVEQHTARERLLHAMTEGSRGSTANLLAAVELLDDPDLDAPTRDRFIGVIRDEAQAMGARLHDLAEQAAQTLQTRWPLEQMHGADLVQAALRRIETLDGLRAAAAEVDATLWLEVDSYALLQALAYLAARLRDEFEVRAVQLRLSPAGERRAHLDLVWTGQAMSTETVMSWEMDPMAVGSDRTSMTVRDVVQRHEGEFWFERDRARHQAFFRFLLPLSAVAAGAADAVRAPHDSRPEFYDFDLFAQTESRSALDDRRLAELAYTVFDTETTGLDPSSGDEILQIGATRLVNGRLLRGECFDQLVDPQRPIPPASIPIHGIEPSMVEGQPTIDAVLPAFHAFARDTVLVAHNAAFDLRFLQMKEARTGLRFDQPVLDTLLLSAVVHPNQASHRLEEIAERFGVDVIGRHTALGDAMVTAEVFLKLLPLLAEQGIHTLGQAREAAQKTFYARLRY